MPSPRAVLVDIEEFGLSHDVAYTKTRTNGRLASPISPTHSDVLRSGLVFLNEHTEKLAVSEVVEPRTQPKRKGKKKVSADNV